MIAALNLSPPPARPEEQDVRLPLLLAVAGAGLIATGIIAGPPSATPVSPPPRATAVDSSPAIDPNEPVPGLRIMTPAGPVGGLFTSEDAVSTPAEALQPPMTLSDLVAIAMSRNPSLAQASARVEAARGHWIQAGLPPNPMVGFAGAEIGDEGNAGQLGMIVRQEIIQGGKLSLSRRAAIQQVQQASQEFEAQQLRVLTDVRTGYYDVLIAERSLAIADRLVRIGEEAAHAAETLFRAQEASRIDWLQARVEAQSAYIVRDNSANRYSAAWRSLAAVVGEPGMQPVPLAGNVADGIEQVGWEDALSQVLYASPQLAAAAANVRRAQWAVRRAQAEPIPNLNLQGVVQYDDSTNNAIAGAQVGLPIPIFNRNQGGIRQAWGELRAAQADVSRLELELQHRLAQVFERYDNARRQVARYTERILPEAKESLDLTAIGYQAGEVDYLTLLTVQRTYFQANLSYLHALRELRFGIASINGLLLSNSLEGR